ncbi:MAG: lipase [Bacteroidota bacterium]
MNPKKISVFIIVALGVLFGMTFLSTNNATEDGSATDGFAVFNTVVKYPTTDTFLMTEAVSKNKIVAIDSIVSNIEQVVEEVEEEEVEPVPQIPDFSKIDTARIQRIVYPEDKTAFIQKLKGQLKSGSCRIIHYGDSQLEGDRISAYVRNRLQRLYGGGGPGFIPIKQVYHQVSAHVVSSDNWMRYAAFDPTKKKFSHKKYGVYTSVSRFTTPNEVPLDSLDLDTIPLTQATITIGTSKKSYVRLRKFKKIGLHYGNVQTPTTIKVLNNGVLLKDDVLKTDGNYHNFQINVPDTPSNLVITLESKISPDFYGLTLDSGSGIALDNVAMRGASGTIFAGLNSKNFQAMVSNLTPKIFILQYGGNTVPHLKDSTRVDRYALYILGNINWIRRKAPKASIVFIGPSDMTTTENGRLRTYSLLPYLDEKLRETCITNNIAYWSIYNAMGGENSMQHWVDQKLASTDYTHFSSKGTKVISELFFTALYLDLTE